MLKEAGRFWEGTPRGKSRNICLPFTVMEEATSHIVSSVPILLPFPVRMGLGEGQV